MCVNAYKPLVDSITSPFPERSHRTFIQSIVSSLLMQPRDPAVISCKKKQKKCHIYICVHVYKPLVGFGLTPPPPLSCAPN